ncbi:MAG: hypothetical protein LKE79_04195 [Lachnospiraceae bacterium]|nr:hypothetical protein [Lachnospiraceae bacterium]MCH4063808.1 hypothetical protein [Lachnospiraceae bacterium]MCI1334579.1 hypothetical protein [Lachnospiraceae bacterium]
MRGGSTKAGRGLKKSRVLDAGWRRFTHESYEGIMDFLKGNGEEGL